MLIRLCSLLVLANLPVSSYGFNARPLSSPRTFTRSTRRTATLKPYIETLIQGERHLTSEETEAAFTEILQGADEVQVGSLLTLLRAREETPEEIAGMVKAMNAACNRVDLGDKKLLDIVGTGGDGADSFRKDLAHGIRTKPRFHGMHNERFDFYDVATLGRGWNRQPNVRHKRPSK